MPDTLTPPPLAPAAGEEPAPYVCVWDHVARYLTWLDAANGRRRRPCLAQPPGPDPALRPATPVPRQEHGAAA
jgi:hypothetical protein